jgi:hypothetical protein
MVLSGGGTNACGGGDLIWFGCRVFGRRWLDKRQQQFGLSFGLGFGDAEAADEPRRRQSFVAAAAAEISGGGDFRRQLGHGERLL